MKTIEWALIGLSVFLLLDSFISLLLGSRYMLWGLEYAPAAYRDLIKRISVLPQRVLLGIKFAEMAAGILLLWLGLRLVS